MINIRSRNVVVIFVIFVVVVINIVVAVDYDFVVCVIDVVNPRKQPLKFGQNYVNNKWKIVAVVVVVLVLTTLISILFYLFWVNRLVRSDFPVKNTTNKKTHGFKTMDMA